ncbi:MAG: family metallopeptidase [Clostridia bacterium]|jgi:septal ring factor EnvC (AmiA/AmiB activator)|nr:family metallopeptidase [Clostridia bacterium]
MIIKKIGQFLKKYAFYVAIGVVSVGALAAIFLVPGRDGNVKEEPNPYAKNEEAVGRVVDDITDDTNNGVVQYEEPNSEVQQENIESQDAVPQENTAEAEQVKDEQIVAETFESTTVNAKAEPFFAEGDTFVWPVSGQVIVPYTDEGTKHWFSEALNQTMRTFGICISASEGEEVKAVADGKVIDILDDSSTLNSDLPYVGKTVIIDHGNGYKSLYGFQNGSPDKNLLGQVVRAGEVIGTAGSPAGAFIKQGENIYLQAMHNEEIVDPLKLLDYKQEASSTGAEGVDMGHTPDEAQ